MNNELPGVKFQELPEAHCEYDNYQSQEEQKEWRRRTNAIFMKCWA